MLRDCGAPTASVGEITDPDGRGLALDSKMDDRFTFRWQWIRVTRGRETPIGGATDGYSSRVSAYHLTPADVGSQLKVRLHFRDDRSNLEEWESAPFPPGGTILPAATCGRPSYRGGATQIWSAGFDVHQPNLDQPIYGVEGGTLGGNRPPADTFAAGSSYTISRIQSHDDDEELRLTLGGNLTADDRNQLTLHVCGEACATPR